MTRKIRYYLIALIAGIISVSAFPLSAQKIELRVESASRGGAIEVGQRFYIYVICKNLQEEPRALTSAGGAEVNYWTLQSTRSSFTSHNGHMSQSKEDIYVATCTARKKGSYSVGPVTVGNVKSNVARYSIVDAGASPDPYGRPGSGDGGGAADDSGDPSQGVDSSQTGPTFIGKGNDQLFMRASVSKTTAYEQEALVYTVKLYTTYNSIKFIGATEAPKFDGFVIEESKAISNQLVVENYQGRSYATAVIARYIIFPQMPGKLKILGNKYTVSADANEYYHDPYYSMLTVRRPVQLNVSPNDLEVTVNPLPLPKPANFSGGVGKFNLTSSLPSSNLTANQAASIKYIVSGEGNLKYVNLPDLNAIFPDELEVFTPSTDVKTNVGASNVGGTVTFDYSFMPLEQGVFTIPEVELVYFDPATGKYETAKTKSYRLNVARGSESSRSQAILTFNSRLMNVDVSQTPEERPAIRGFLYWLWYIIPAVLLVVVAIFRRRYIASRADIMGLKSRRAGKMARRRLKKAISAMKSGNEGLFYDEILKAVWGYLSDKLRLPTSELNRDNVSSVLERRGIASENITRLLKLLDDSEFAKYSPASLRKPMSEVYDETTEILNMLEDSFSGNRPGKPKDDGSASGDMAKGSSETPETTSGGKLTIMLLLFLGMLSGSVVAQNGNAVVDSARNPSVEVASTDNQSESLNSGEDRNVSVDPARNVAAADKAYADGKFEEAVALYKKAIGIQGATAPLLFNLGCAYYKMGNEGEARLCFERAKKLDPSNSRINQNLEYIATRVEDANKAELKGKKGNVSPDAPGFFKRVGNKVAVDTSSDFWAQFAAMSFILMLLAIALYLFIDNVRLRKTGFFSAIIFLFFTVVFIIFSEMAANHFLSKDEAIVTSFKTVLTSDPHDADKVIGSPLCRGTKLEILESQLDADGKIGWYKVKLNSSNIGWVEAADLTVI